MQNQSDPPWHEDPQFWVELREGIFDEQLWANAEAEVSQLLALVPLQPTAAVLDIPCGPGRHMGPRARKRMYMSPRSLLCPMPRNRIL